jgi:hypothetical protein
VLAALASGWTRHVHRQGRAVTRRGGVGRGDRRLRARQRARVGAHGARAASGPTLGNAEAGAAAALAGVRASVASAGVLCVLGSVALALALPRFWAYDARPAREGPPPPAHGVAPAPPP